MSKLLKIKSIKSAILTVICAVSIGSMIYFHNITSLIACAIVCISTIIYASKTGMVDLAYNVGSMSNITSMMLNVYNILRDMKDGKADISSLIRLFTNIYNRIWLNKMAESI